MSAGLAPAVVTASFCLVRFPNCLARPRSRRPRPPGSLCHVSQPSRCPLWRWFYRITQPWQRSPPIPTYTKIVIILLTPSHQFVVHMGCVFHRVHTQFHSLLFPLNVLAQPPCCSATKTPLRLWRAVNFHWFHDALSSWLNVIYLAILGHLGGF